MMIVPRQKNCGEAEKARDRTLSHSPLHGSPFSVRHLPGKLPRKLQTENGEPRTANEVSMNSFLAAAQFLVNDVHRW
jgi:hypothetical protein